MKRSVSTGHITADIRQKSWQNQGCSETGRASRSQLSESGRGASVCRGARSKAVLDRGVTRQPASKHTNTAQSIPHLPLLQIEVGRHHSGGINV